MKRVFEFVKNIKLHVANDKIKQTERNAMRATAMENLLQVLRDAGYECGMTSEGIAVNVDNEDWGYLAFVLDIKVKDLTYDAIDEWELYAANQEQKRKEAEAKARAKASKIKADAEARARKRAEAEANK